MHPPPKDVKRKTPCDRGGAAVVTLDGAHLAGHPIHGRERGRIGLAVAPRNTLKNHQAIKSPAKTAL
jgi:hypothetical protein